MKRKKYKSERYSKPSEMVKCDFCDFVAHARGIKTHLRKAHHLQVKERVVVREVSDAPVNSIVSVSDKAILTTKVKLKVTSIEWLYEPVRTGDGKSKQRKKDIINEIRRSLGLFPIPKKSIDDIRKENDAWLNSDEGKKYLQSHHDYENKR